MSSSQTELVELSDPRAGPPRGGAGGTMTPWPMGFRGPMGFVGFREPSRGPMCWKGPIEMTLRHQHLQPEDLFFFFFFGRDYFTESFQVKENKTKMRNIHPRIFHLLF